MVEIDINDICGVGKTSESRLEEEKDSLVILCTDVDKNIRITGNFSKIRDLLGQAIHTIDGE